MSSTPLMIRIPTHQVEKLEEMARQRRQQTGDMVGRVDLIREAVTEYLERQAPQERE